MKAFMDKDFLLENAASKKLFEIAAKQPIFDYHCHLSPMEIYENRQFPDIAAVWLGGDHYKWRVMRSYGIDEKYMFRTMPPMKARSKPYSAKGWKEAV